MQSKHTVLTENSLPSIKPVDVPNKIIAVSAGIELYHLNSQHQISYFTVYSADTDQWLTYQLPALPDRESCPQAGTPLIMPSGTLYIAASGGIINRLTPMDDGNYKHSYIIIGETTEFIDNTLPAHLIAEGDKPVASPQIVTSATDKMGGTHTIEDRRVSFFQSFNDSKAPMIDQPPFNMLVKQGLQTQDEHEQLWTKQREGYPSLKKGMETLAQLSDDKKTDNNLFQLMTSKDGPAKEEKKVIWNKEANKLRTKAEIMTAVSKMHPGLQKTWGLLLEEKEGKCKFKPETMPYQKVKMAAIPGEPNTAVVCMMGRLFTLDDNTVSLTHLAVITPSTQRTADCTGIAALDANTFIISDMGLKETLNGPRTLRIVKSSGEQEETATNTLLTALAPLWRENQTPRIKSITASTSINGVTSLYIRTKHAGNDVIKADITYTSGKLEVLIAYPLPVSDTFNNEYLSAYDDKLLCGMETEDYMCQFNLFSRAQIKALEHTHINCYMTTPNMANTAPQHPASVAPHLPAFIPYTGHGLSGIAAI